MPTYEKTFYEGQVILSDPGPGGSWNVEVYATVSAEQETIAIIRGGEKPTDVRWFIYFSLPDAYASSLLEIQQRVGHVAVSWAGEERGQVKFASLDIGKGNNRKMAGVFDLGLDLDTSAWKLVSP
jgi:hypothetical protein